MGAQFVPYMEPSFWKGLPKAKAEEFARFLKFVTQGSSLMTNMWWNPAITGFRNIRPRLTRQRTVDLERSLDGAKRRML